MEVKYNTKDFNNSKDSLFDKEKQLSNFKKGIVVEISSGPYINKETYEKDKKKISKYGQAFYDFFYNTSYQKLPMFTHYPDPRAVKHIVVDTSHYVMSGHELFLYIMPFTKYCLCTLDGTNYTYIHDYKPVACFQSYKVVAAKIMVKQVGVLQAADGFGTIMDAVVVQPTASFESLKHNLLSVQVAPSKKIMMVDGRSGIQANFIGSPLYEDIYPEKTVLKPSLMSITFANYPFDQPTEEDFKTFIPAHSAIIPLTFPGNTSAINVQGEGEHADLTKQRFENRWCITRQTDSVMAADVPEGSALFLRVSPPGVNVTIKAYVELIVEGPLKPEYWMDVPQFSPELVCPFEKISYALHNCIPSLTTMSKGDFLVAASTLHKNIIPPDCDIKTNLFLRGRLFPEKKRSLSHKEKELKERPVKKTFLVTSQQVHDVDNLMRLSTVGDGFFKHQNEYLNISDFGFDPGKYYYASNQLNEISIKNLFKVKGTSNTVTIPEVPKNLGAASMFVGYPVTTLSSTPLTNRIFVDADTPLPLASYQYFPVVDLEKKTVFPVPLCVKNSADNTTTAHKSFRVIDSGGVQRTIKFHYRQDDFQSEEEFLGVLKDLVNYAYARNFHYSQTPEISIRIFADKPIAQKSYMLALLAALYGAPSGAYLTGSFSIDGQGNIVVDEMGQDVQELKLDSATVNSPLLILAKNVGNGAFTNIISGIVPDYAGGKGMMVNNVDTALLYVCLPLKSRLVKATPESNWIQSDKHFLTKKMAQPYRWYICYSNIKSTPKLEDMFDKKQIYFKDFQRATLDRYCTVVTKNKKYISAATFYSEHPELLNSKHIWHFYVDGKLFVEKNTFLGDIASKQYPFIKPYTTDISQQSIEAFNKVREISLEDVEAMYKKALKGSEEDRRRMRSNLEDIVVNNAYPDKSIAFKELKKVVAGFSDVLSSLSILLKKNFGSNPVSENSSVMSALNFLNMNTRVDKPEVIQKDESFKFVTSLIEKLGNGALATAAHADDWAVKMRINPQAKLIVETTEFFKNNPLPKVEKKPEIEEESINNRNRITKKKNEKEDEKEIPQEKKKKKKAKKILENDEESISDGEVSNDYYNEEKYSFDFGNNDD